MQCMVCHYPMRGILIIYFVGINLVTFLLYGVDKWKARKGRWRIPEDSLIWLAVAGGSIGALGRCASSAIRPGTASSRLASRPSYFSRRSLFSGYSVVDSPSLLRSKCHSA